MSRVIVLCVVLVTGVCWTATRASAQAQQRLRSYTVRNFTINVYSGSEWTSERWDLMIDTELARVQRAVELSDSQLFKLRLAARGDVSNFLANVEAAKAEFVAKGGGKEVKMERFREILRTASELAGPLKAQLRGDFFGDSSLYQKITRSALHDEQVEMLEEYNRQRQQDELQLEVDIYVAKLNRQVPMTTQQRETVAKWITKDLDSISGDEQYLQQVIKYYCSQYDTKKLDQVFDKPQRKALQKIWKPGERMKNLLKGKGLIRDE